jgi:hypothetical protein
VLAVALVRPPVVPQPVLRRGQVVGQPLLLGDLLGVQRLPASPFRAAALDVTGVAAAVHPRPAVTGRVEVDHGGRHVREQRPVVADQHDHTRVGPQPVGEVGQPARVEVVGRLVEQQHGVPRAEQARQPDPVPLPDRQRAERPGAVVDGVQRGQRDLDPPVGVPRVQRLGRRERGGVLLVGAGFGFGERGGGAVEPGQRTTHGRQLEVDEITDGLGRAERELLVGHPDRTRAAHLAPVGGQVTGEHPQQGGLATPVLPDDGDPVTRGGDEIDAGEHGPPTEGDMNSGRADVRRARRGERKMGRHDGTASSKR